MKKQLLTFLTALAVMSSGAFAQSSVSYSSKPAQGEVLPIGNYGALNTIHSSVLKSSSATVPGTALFQDDFSSNKGWTLGSSWAIGAAVSKPVADHTQQGDNGIMACPLGVDYSNNMVRSEVVSPVIDCTGKSAALLNFWSFSGCEGSSYDHMGVEVYNGTSWVTLWSNTSSFQESAWTNYEYDVSSYAANNSNFQVRFFMGTTDGSVVYSGWAIDDLVVYEPLEHDLAVMQINVPSTTFSSEPVTPVVTVKNFGASSEDNYSVVLKDGGTEIGTVVVSSAIAPFGTTDLTFPDWTPAEGVHTLTATLILATDLAVDNNTSTVAVSAIPRQHDLAVNAISVSTPLFSGEAVTPSVTIMNEGDYSENAYRVTLSDGDTYNETIDISPLIAIDGTYQMSFPAWIPIAAGDYTLTATVILTDDDLVTNNVGTLEVAVVDRQHDLSVSAIAPGYVKSGSAKAPVVTVVNSGDYDESEYLVTLSDGHNYSVEVKVTTSVLIGQSFDVVFPDWTPADGTQTLTAVVILTNDPDADASNNTLSRECLVRVPRMAYTSKYIGVGANERGVLMVPSDEYVTIGNSSDQIQGMAWKDGVLYGVTYAGVFGTLNIKDGSFAPIGSTEINVSYYTSLMCDPTTGVLYLVTLTWGAPSFTVGLYTVNPQTGAASLVANSSHNGTISQTAFDENGNLYGIENISGENGQFYAINKSTAEMTLIGDMGGNVSANFQPMVWDDHEDVMYFQASKGNDGNMQGTYVIDVATGAATLIGTPYSSQIIAMTIPDFDANLSDLAVDAIPVAGFSPDIYSYNVLLPSGTTDVPQVTYQTAYPNADVQLTDATALPGTTTVVVTAPDATTRTYTIHFTVSATTNVALADLTVSGKTIAGFSPATLVYNYVLPSGTTVVPVITATTADVNATAVVTAAASLPGATTVVVTAQDGVSTQTYTVNFLVLANDVATLSDIRVNGISIVNFDAVTSTYNVELPYGISFVPKVRATATDANATMTVTDATVLPGVATVVVKAADNTTTLTYTINLTVAAPSADASLSDLKVAGVSLSDFSSSDYDYNVILPQGTSIVPLLTAVSTEGHANVVVTNAAVLTGASSVLVTAQDGTTQLTYTVNFSVSTGIDETSDLAMTIYQIPSEEKVVVQMGTIIQSVSVLNINGLKIQQSKFNSNEAVIRTFGMNSGIYVLQIVTADGVVTSKIQISK